MSSLCDQFSVESHILVFSQSTHLLSQMGKRMIRAKLALRRKKPLSSCRVRVEDDSLVVHRLSYQTPSVVKQITPVQFHFLPCLLLPQQS